MGIEDTVMKKCKICKLDKTLNEFDKKGSKVNPNLLRVECKECRKEYNKRKYIERKEKGYYKKPEKSEETEN